MDYFSGGTPELRQSEPAASRAIVLSNLATLQYSRPLVRLQPWMKSAASVERMALEQDQMEVIVAHELEERSFKEMAAETGVSVNTLRSRKR